MKERLTVLVENNIVAKEIADYTLDVYNDFIVAKGLDGAPAEVFLTHLAMASQRIKDDEIVNYMDDAILADIKNFEKFDEVVELTNAILEKSIVVFPESEVQFLWLHMCNIIK